MVHVFCVLQFFFALEINTDDFPRVSYDDILLLFKNTTSKNSVDEQDKYRFWEKWTVARKGTYTREQAVGLLELIDFGKMSAHFVDCHFDKDSPHFTQATAEFHSVILKKLEMRGIASATQVCIKGYQ